MMIVIWKQMVDQGEKSNNADYNLAMMIAIWKKIVDQKKSTEQLSN